MALSTGPGLWLQLWACTGYLQALSLGGTVLSEDSVSPSPQDTAQADPALGASQVSWFLPAEGETSLHQRRDDGLLYCNTCFIAVA